jgi:hypothetical protein
MPRSEPGGSGRSDDGDPDEEEPGAAHVTWWHAGPLRRPKSGWLTTDRAYDDTGGVTDRDEREGPEAECAEDLELPDERADEVRGGKPPSPPGGPVPIPYPNTG